MINSSNKLLPKAALIGLGAIALEYELGLKTTDKFNLIAVCDTNAESGGRKCFQSLPFYNSIETLIEKETLDLLIISTPPSSHYELVKFALMHDINVIVEKPMILDYEKIQELYKLAEDRKLVLNTSYHWQNGEEVRHLIGKIKKDQIAKINVAVDDPYSNNSIDIRDDRKHLEGSWIDSGVNALSYIKLFLPFNHFLIKNMDVQFAKNIHQPIYSSIDLVIDDVEINITVDWRNNKNFKRSEIYLKDGTRFFINHSEQKIIFNDKEECYDDMSRLSRHYYNYFNNFNFLSNREETLLIHKILLSVRDEYEKNYH